MNAALDTNLPHKTQGMRGVRWVRDKKDNLDGGARGIRKATIHLWDADHHQGVDHPGIYAIFDYFVQPSWPKFWDYIVAM